MIILSSAYQFTYETTHHFLICANFENVAFWLAYLTPNLHKIKKSLYAKWCAIVWRICVQNFNLIAYVAITSTILNFFWIIQNGCRVTSLQMTKQISEFVSGYILLQHTVWTWNPQHSCSVIVQINLTVLASFWLPDALWEELDNYKCRHCF